MHSFTCLSLVVLYLLHAANGQSALCKDIIATYDCSTDVKREICASNGVTYNTSCDFARAHCLDGTIHILYEGRCNDNPQPDPICSSLINTLCPSINNQVCASDSMTYNNFCEFEKNKCRNPSLALVSLGKCPTVTTQMTTTVSILDLICQGLENVICPTSQPKVCGSDGMTYDSGCDLEKASCKAGSLILLAYAGPC